MLQQVWPWAGILCRDKMFFVATEFGPNQEFLCRDKIFFYVAIEYTLRRNKKFQDMRSSMSRHSVLCRDSGEQRCVTTRRDACATEDTTSYNGKKKKKKKKATLGILGVTSPARKSRRKIFLAAGVI